MVIIKVMYAMSNRYIVCFAFLVASLVFAGCALFGPEEETRVNIRSDKNQYQADQEVMLSVTNESDKPLFALFCGSRLIREVQRYDASWEGYSGTICPAIYAPVFESVAEPGETFQFSQTISEEGRYRVRLTHRIGLEGEEQIGYSNTFMVEE